MTACAGGWFEATANCGPGTRYWYLLQDGTAVPDPASRAQNGDVHGPSIVVDPAAYHWRNEQLARPTLGSERCFTNCMPASSAGSPE